MYPYATVCTYWRLNYKKNSEEEQNKHGVCQSVNINNIEMDFNFAEFHKICRFCLKTNVVLYPLFDENDGNPSTGSVLQYLRNVLNKSIGLEVDS